MDKNKFYELIDEVSGLDEGTIKGDELIETLGWESISIVSFIALVDEEFEIILSAKKVIECQSVEELLQLTEASAS